MSDPNNTPRGPGPRIANIGCGLALAAVFVSAAAAVCIRVIRWGLSS